MTANTDNVRAVLRAAGFRWNGCVHAGADGGVVVLKGYGGTLDDAAATLGERFAVETRPSFLLVRSTTEGDAAPLDACRRCGGAGGRAEWPGFTCFRCGGSGKEQ